LNLDVASKTRLAFKCTPEKFAELIEHECIAPSPYVGRYHWVALEQLDILPVRELEELLRESYEMVAAKTKIGRSRRRVAKARTRSRTSR
jgi:predicted DNA-binding protein (MmcQ/YjbR family)